MKSAGPDRSPSLETRFHEGEGDRPLAVFIHGMGMNMKAWTDPSEARVLGGKYPLGVLVPGAELRTSFHDMQSLGFSVLSWSQSRPVGPIAASVKELHTLVSHHERYARKGLIFVCHSRGGLIARKFLEETNIPLKTLITLATPHHGTSMARLASSVSPMASALSRVLKGFNKRDVETATQRILGFLSSTGLRELLPESGFFSGLKDRKREGVLYVSIGGTKPDLLRVVIPSLPDLLSSLVPRLLVPEEMRDGLGDGLVTAQSSILPYADDHRSFPVNHAAVLFDKDVRNYVAEKAAPLRR